MEGKEFAFGFTSKRNSRSGQNLRHRLTIKTEIQRSQKILDAGPVRKMSRIKTQPSSAFEPSPQPTQNQLTINRRRKYSCLLQFNRENVNKGFDESKINVQPGRLKSIRNKEYNRKSIQMYSSQEFFKTCLNDKTEQQQKAIKIQWRYLGKYGNQFQKMSLKSLANLTKNKSFRKFSLIKRKSQYINIDHEANAWITKSIEANNA